MSRSQLTSTVEQNTGGAVAPFVTGKNAIINGDFGVWQRGTSFDFSSVSGYTADRWGLTWNGSGATRTISQQAFTPGTAPVAGYEGTYFYRYNQSVAGTGGSGNYFYQPIEDVRKFAGQTVTLSFWAKADAARSVSIGLEQHFGTGGSATVTTSVGTATLTTSWVRYSYTLTNPSISGKTVGASSALQLTYTLPANVIQTIDFWGVQLEAGSVATPFTTATGTLSGELTACQRYYWRNTSGSLYGLMVNAGYFTSSTAYYPSVQFPVPMRIAPTSVDFSTLTAQDQTGSIYAMSSLSIDTATVTPFGTSVNSTVSGATAGRYGRVLANNSTTAYLGFSAEL